MAPTEGGRNPSSVAYRIYKPSEDGRYPSHGVSLRPFLPALGDLAECNAGSFAKRLRWRMVIVTMIDSCE